jgi:multidrug efflux pump subunit AcrB
LCFATAGAISSFLLTLPPQFRATRDSHFLNVVARLKSGVTVRQVSDDMLAIANDLKQLYPDSNRYTGARAAFEEADAESLVYHVRPLEDYLAGRLADRRFARALLALFGCLRQMLAGVGAYRVMSYPVALGTREIGLRMALGADARATAGVVLRQSMATTLAGVMISLAAALALTHWLSALLFKARPADPAALGSVTNPLVVVTLAAPAIPARGAAAVDPKAVLRQE